VIKKLQGYAYEMLLAAMLVVGLLIAAKIDHKGFVSAGTQQGLFFDVWNMALLTLPMTLIIITGGIDLSVGSTMALSAVTMGFLYKIAGVPLGFAAVAAVGMGTLCGLFNGVVVAGLRVHPLIVTLATYSLFRGLAEGLSLGLAAAFKVTSVYNLPQGFGYVAHHAFLAGHDEWNPPLYAVSMAGWFFVVAALGFGIVLARTPFGRTLYAIGYNEKAARYSGLRVERSKLLVYALSGLMAGLVALNYCSYTYTAKADVGNDIELEVITAVVLGGTSIFGGRGRIIGTVLGVALIHETREFVSWHFHQDELVKVVLGALLILTVAIHATFGRVSRK